MTIKLQIRDAAAKPVTGAQVHLEGDMSHPGMAPVTSDARETGAGSYQGVLNFNMPGDWVVLAHVLLPDGRTMQSQFDVSGVRAN